MVASDAARAITQKLLSYTPENVRTDLPEAA
jgi:hypothetical protein